MGLRGWGAGRGWEETILVIDCGKFYSATEWGAKRDKVRSGGARWSSSLGRLVESDTITPEFSVGNRAESHLILSLRCSQTSVRVGR